MKPPFKKAAPTYARKFPPGPKPRPAPLNETERKLEFDPENDLIYGAHSVAAALANPKRKPVKLWATENGAARIKGEVKPLPLDPEIVHPRLLDHMLKSADAVHQGIILEARPLQQPRLDQIPRQGLVLVLDQVTDPHNVGAIMRSCAAFNVTALVATARHAADTNGAFLKAASGAFEHVPYVTVTNLARALAELKTYGFTLVGLDSEAPATMDEIGTARPLALVLGAEGKGLRQLTRETCDTVARIDMPGAIKSLNVSIAAAISLYALTRK
ncbi:MAG: 23S rRNA (guanosine(2251)-2'-O)-methyltransferase RlmB [Alphaproteobacteria bacterium]|nr:23S rRNA (guanosine(2251)-2'-O)-methyltransferase RlmB [Alphaproteobacteria bacterium]